MRKVVCFLSVLFLSLSASGQTISDVEFFDVLDLDYEGMESVRTYVESNNYSGARRSYVQYLKQRTTPKWFFDWKAQDEEKRKTVVDLKEANRYANNELTSVGVWYKFGDKIDWTFNATENQYVEWTWQLNRHYSWFTLGAAYWNTGDEKYAKAFVSQLNSWIDQCKCPNDNGYYPGSPWRTLEAGLRMRVTWPNSFFYFLSSPSFDDESIFRMVKSIYEHAMFLYGHRKSKQRLSHEMSGLYTVGALFPEFKDADEWRSIGVEELYNEEVEQFYPDGAQKELAPGYHGTNLSCILSVYELAKINNYTLPRYFETRLESIFEYYAKVIMPDGKLPAVNDSRWIECKDNLELGSGLFKNRDDFAYLATNGEKGKKPKYTSVWMPWAGWYIMRSGWDREAFYAFFEVGPYGTAHQHEDKLSFILYAYGSRLITDCGNYSYDESKWRDYAVSARGHNVVRIDGKDQNRFSVRNLNGVSESTNPLSNIWKSNRRYDIGEGFYNEVFGSDSDSTIKQHRIVKFVKNKYWLVSDEFIPSDNREHTYETWFHFNNSNYKFDSSSKVVYSNDESEANVAIVRLNVCNDISVIVGQTNPEVQGWVADGSSSGNYSCRPVATPVYKDKGKGVVKNFYVFIPFRSKEKIMVSRVDKLSSKKYKINLENGERYVVKL